MRRNPFGPSVGLVIWGGVATAFAFSSAPSALRAVAVFSFALMAPGLALVGILRPMQPLERIVLAVGASVSLALVTGEVMALAHLWHPPFAVALLALLTAAGARLAEVRRRLQPVPLERPTRSVPPTGGAQ